MRYPGGKFRLYQRIINLMPPHRVYIETHLGGGAVLRHKAPALLNIGIDKDSRVFQEFDGFSTPNYTFIQGDAGEFLNAYKFKGEELVYADPPYPGSSRRSTRSPYRFDYSDQQHVSLLKTLLALPCHVMISSYPNDLYEGELNGWTQHRVWGTSHTGSREEIIWTNFKPTELHDLRFIGSSFRDRQTVKRKRQRWAERFRDQPAQVQQAILHDLMGVYRERLKRETYECNGN